MPDPPTDTKYYEFRVLSQKVLKVTVVTAAKAKLLYIFLYPILYIFIFPDKVYVFGQTLQSLRLNVLFFVYNQIKK